MTSRGEDIGQGVRIERVEDAHGEWVGLIRRHPRKGAAGECASAVAFSTPASRAAHREGMPLHDLVSTDPLTLSPSLLCTTCGHHGHIQGGRWVGD